MKKKFGEKWEISQIIKGHKESIYTISFNYIKNIFATGSTDGKIYLWSTISFKNLSTFKDNSGSIQSIIFDEKFDYIFSGGNDFLLKQWDIKTNTIIRKYYGHVSSIIKIVKNPILNILITGSKDNTIRLWDFRIQKQITVLNAHKNEVTSLLTNRESPHLISGGLDDNLCFWDLISVKNLLNLKNNNREIKEMCKFKHNDNFSVLSSGSINFYRKDGIIIKKIVNKTNSNECFTIDQNNNIAIGCTNGKIKYKNFYNHNGWLFFKTFSNKFFTKKQCNNTAIEFDEKGNRIFLIGTDKNIKVFSKRWFLFY